MKIKTAVFPVAGLGTRFLPATKAIPKEMLIVVDKPLIQYAVEEAIAAGIERFIFVTAQGKTAIEDHFDVSQKLEEELTKRNKLQVLEKAKNAELAPGKAIFIRQQRPLGLGHAVLCAKSLVEEEAFALILADDLILTPNSKPCLQQMVEDYDLKKNPHMCAVMQVPPTETQQYGILDFDATQQNKNYIHAKNIVEKPQPAAAPSNMAVIGRYILNRSIFQALENQTAGIGGEIQITDAMQKQIPDIGLQGYKFKGQRFDCGKKMGWMEANVAFAMHDESLKQQMLDIINQHR